MSLWLEAAEDGVRRPPLAGDTHADVAVVGAGFTGLWTAYYLARTDPGLRVVVLERETAGFGASGRNGGWCSALFPASWDRVARASSADAAGRLRQALVDTVDEVGRVAAAERLDVHYAKGGTLTLATMPAHLPRLRAMVAAATPGAQPPVAVPPGAESSGAGSSGAESSGSGPPGVRWLSAAETAERVRCAGVLGAVYDPHCAALHPGLLV